MKKAVIKIVGAMLILTLGAGVGFSLFANRDSKEVVASVGSYSRDQATYYTSDFSHKVTSGQYGTTLLSTLHELMYDTHKSYNTYDELFEYLKYTDTDLDNEDNVILLYSRQSTRGNQNANIWNREHVWCQSHGFFNTGVGAGSDMHHLRPASTAYNSTRSNKPYGLVSHTSDNQMGETDCYATDSAFEPADYIKGDVARVLMYVYMHYASAVGGTSTYTGTLNITDIVTTTTGTDQAAWDLLMDWNEADPVDYREMHRNNKASYYLGNFNPFIDHPEFARMIWDDSSSYQSGLFFQSSYKTVNVGSSYTNTASKYGNVSTSDSVVYTSDNPSIATVNISTGQVTGVSNGIARIKARATINGIEKMSYHFVKVGSGYTPKNTLTSSGIVYTPVTKTSAVASATIGSETITYSTTHSSYISQITKDNSVTLTINNFPKTITSIILYMHSNQKGGSGSINITVGGSTYKSISASTFKSIYGKYTQSFVPVDVTNSSASKKTGTIVITIAATANSLFFEKAVVDYSERSITKATGISVSPSSIEMTPGEDNAFSPVFTPSTTTLQTCTWSSSNTSIATVNQFGIVKAIAIGSATITATASDGSGKTGTASVSVVSSIPSGDPTVTGVTVSPSSTTLDVYSNPSTTLTATVNGTNNPSQAVTWSVYSSSPSGCAIVNGSGVVNALAEGTAVIRATSDADPTYYGSCTVTITDSTPVVTSISASVSKTYYVGETITSADITVKDNLDNTIDVFSFSNNNYQFTYSDASSGGSLTNKTFTNSINAAGKTCSLTVQVQRKAHEDVGTVSDTLNLTYTGQSGTTYGSWSNKAAPNSSAYYNGHNAGGNLAIQLRSTATNNKTYTTDTYSGVVSSTSGGLISSVSVSWNANSADNRSLSVYGKNTAYSTPNDLFNDSTRGTLLGTITKGTSTSITVDSSYTYVGVRSANGAIYLDSITFTYGSEDTAVNLSNYIMYTDTANQCETKFDVAKGYFEDLSSAERSTFMTSDDYVISTSRTRLQAWANHLGKSINYTNGDYVIANARIINPIINNKDNGTVLIVVISSLLSVTAIGGYFFFRKQKQ